MSDTGGSFGVVYKAIERATGETVAVKHVSVILQLPAFVPWHYNLVELAIYTPRGLLVMTAVMERKDSRLRQPLPDRP